MRSDREPGDGTVGSDGAAISVIDRGYPGGEPYARYTGCENLFRKNQKRFWRTLGVLTPNPPTGLMPETMWT